MLLFLFLIPKGLNSIKILGDDIRPDLINNENTNVLSFTSISNDLLLVIDADNKIFTQPVYDWVSSIVFDLQINPLIQNLTDHDHPIDNIYTQGQQMLNTYLTNLYLIIATTNVTTFVLINGTYYYYKNWSDTGNASYAYTMTKNYLQNQLYKLSTGYFLIDFANTWLSKLLNFTTDINISDLNYSELLDEIRSNQDYWMENLVNDQLKDIFSSFINILYPNTKWSENVIFSELSNILFGYNNNTSQSFLLQVFGGGEAQTPIRIARENLMKFLRQEYIPLGFPKNLFDFYLSIFTNSNGSTEVTSTIIKIPLKSNLTETEITKLLDFAVDFAENLTSNNPFSYNVYLFSELNYNRERGKQLTHDLKIIDYFTIIFAILVLLYVYRNIYLTISIVSLSWLITETTRGIIVLILPKFFELTDSGFSLGTTIIHGAMLNYSVFISYRYMEEIGKTSDITIAIEKTMRTAMHSILISGTAIMLTFIPLFSSSSTIVAGLSSTTVFGIFFQLLQAIVIFPIYFITIDYLKIALLHNNRKIIIHKPSFHKITKENGKYVIIFSVMLLILSMVIVYYSKPSIQVNDFIGESGQTGMVMKHFDSDYPPNYLSKLLIQVHHTYEPTLDNISNLIPIINDLSNRLNNTGDITNLISIAWPLGYFFNITDDNLALVPRTNALLIASQLIDSDTNSTFIILQIKYSDTSQDVLYAVMNIKDILDEFASKYNDVANISISGYLAETTKLAEDTISELPIEISMAILLLTVFLWWRLKSFTVPFRLELTIIFGSIYALAIGTLIWNIFYGPLNLLINATSIITLLGLGTDFDIYLYMRVLEEKEKIDDYPTAIHNAIEKSSAAIISSGLVMVGSFFALMTADLRIIRQFGIVTAIAILLDIFVIRMYLVPAFLIFMDKFRKHTNNKINNN